MDALANSKISALPQALDQQVALSVGEATQPTRVRAKELNPEELREAARQYESFFISYLLKVMRETVHETGLNGKGAAYFYSFYDQEIGNRAAQAGGIGIARMVEAYIEKNLSPPPQVSAETADKGSERAQKP